MKKLRRSKRSLRMQINIGWWILFGLITFGMVFYFLIVPCVVAYGVITGRLDIETLEPSAVQEQTIENDYCGFGGY